jgi:hypothetical protein
MSRTAYVAGFAIASAACAHSVREDAASGRDGTQAGARIVRIDHGTATLSGIVTYPGGDRVDWAEIALPEHERGTLDLRLGWTPPRPGLQLAFDVFDGANRPVASADSAGTDARRTGNRRSATVQGATGSYYVRIFAVERGDAGAYRLTATFRPDPEPAAPPVELAAPPRPGEVSEPELPCATSTDPGGPPCGDDREPGVAPRPAGRRFASTDRIGDVARPITSRIRSTMIQSSVVVVVIDAGTDQGVLRTWKATVLRGDGDAPLDGGDIILLRVERRIAVGKTHLTVEQLADNPRVRLTPP